MPHDKNGQELKVGDRVTIRAEVTDVQAQPDYCNCSVKTCEPMHPGEHCTTITLNTKQVEKCCGLGLVGATASQKMHAVGLSWPDVQDYGQHIVHLLQTQGTNALAIVTGMVKIAQLALDKDFAGVFVQLNAEVVNVEALIAAVKVEFGLS